MSGRLINGVSNWRFTKLLVLILDSLGVDA